MKKITTDYLASKTGISARTLARYKVFNPELFEMLKIGAFSQEINFSQEDFLTVKKIETLYSISNEINKAEKEKWFKIGHALYTKRPKTIEQIEAIKLGMLAKANKLDIDSISAYKKILSRIKL